MNRKERRRAFEKFLCMIRVFLPLPSDATGGGGPLFTLLSTFAFLDGSLPCNEKENCEYFWTF